MTRLSFKAICHLFVKRLSRLVRTFSAVIFAYMPRPKIISIVLAMLMLIQIVPVQKIGKALSQNQWTEEIPHGNETHAEDGHFVKAMLFSPFVSHTSNKECSKALIYIHISEQIPSNHSTDVVSPPPDRC
ncbi:hypothetical protein EXU57_13790 [Segetibacter sp. 3557_3]|uniref:hypothetical protein n=1 Tax=Segetibacter sp. 3557_3 TaxID=2547429 RepID=UPI001058C232|nr:hypothetical protein [Segetibacter sp. 3557_3]TDH25173.1 hypothetical protein EXU57_13790 [Segetibacter sp. 3557_3]